MIEFALLSPLSRYGINIFCRLDGETRITEIKGFHDRGVKDHKHVIFGDDCQSAWAFHIRLAVQVWSAAHASFLPMPFEHN